MGVSIQYVGEKRRKAALRRAIWNSMEMELPGSLDADSAYEVMNQMCRILFTVIEDMKNIQDFRKAGYEKRHWYNIELQISEDKVEMQNTLEGATPCAPPPTNIPWHSQAYQPSF